jgi:hypothetical protein
MMNIKVSQEGLKVWTWLSLLKKTKRDAGAQHVGDGKFRHPVGRATPSTMWMKDFSDVSTWMTEFFLTRMLCSCVTLGFLNSRNYEHTFCNLLYN